MGDIDFYPIGTRGKAWAVSEIEQWRALQTRRRRYDADIVARVEAMADRYDIVEYGQLDYAGDHYPLLALRDKQWDPALPAALITGGVHGYETSGIQGALGFLETRAPNYAEQVNLIVVPCVSPWGYERINRWNYDAIDPNRNFRADGSAQEATALIDLVRSTPAPFLLHIDLHETTDSDASEFSPALAARDGLENEAYIVPDGFYLVDDRENPQPYFQRAIISAVECVTHIASPDKNGRIIGAPVVERGVIQYPLQELGICASITRARFTTSTEVYPDSHLVTREQCNRAQITAICAGLEFAIGSK